jgi:DUF1365 family protein
VSTAVGTVAAQRVAIERADLPELPALVAGWVTHQRYQGVRHGFRHRLYQWLVDLDSLPRLPRYLRPFAGFRSEDHLGDPGQSIKQNIGYFLARQGIDLGGQGRIVMLANPRVLGHVFNPLSVFWCFDCSGDLAAVVAEVHNTYGERHAYLLRPAVRGAAQTPKRFHVSPFFDVTGDYVLRFTLARDRVATTVTLRSRGNIVFTAAFVGRPEAATPWTLTRRVVRTPLMPQRITLLIRAHGTWLWLRRLPVQSHPHHDQQAGV